MTSPSSSTRASSSSARPWNGSRSRMTWSPAWKAKSSLGRLGLLIHSTAGFVDAGFSGNLTLELSNVANLPITIYKGMPIGQLSFMRMDRAVDTAYGADGKGSKYQGQAEPTASRYYLNFGTELLHRPVIRARRRFVGTIGVQMIPNIGPLEIVIVLIIALIVFGPKRPPELGKSLGRG